MAKGNQFVVLVCRQLVCSWSDSYVSPLYEYSVCIIQLRVTRGCCQSWHVRESGEREDRLWRKFAHVRKQWESQAVAKAGMGKVGI